MTKKVVTIVLLVSLTTISCNQITKQETKHVEVTISKTEEKTNLLVGSWVEPNPINEKEMQGIKINSDGTAESINMATLLYKKWWKDADKLFLVSESIGNGSSSIDTTKYEIVKLNEKEIELKDRDYIIKYKRK
jgi:hypothetical protein